MHKDNEKLVCAQCGWTGTHDDTGITRTYTDDVKTDITVCPECKHDIFNVKKT